MDTPAVARTRIWAVLVLLLAAVLTLTGTAGNASAATGSTNENRVKAIGAETINAVGPGEHISAGQRRGDALPQHDLAQGHGVHTYYVMPTAADGATGQAVLVHNANGACDLGGARQVRGRFPNEADPGETLVRNDPITGSPTHYQVYDANGLPVKRVDLTGKAHDGIPTPHVQEFDRNVNPATGQSYVNPGQVRAARPEEVP